jgi:argininosuccinate lyase
VKFATEYIEYVLNENFENAKSLFLSPLLAIHRAHLVMLVEQGIVAGEDGRALGAALEGIVEPRVREMVYDGTCEDLFFHIERLIIEAAGEDCAGRLHTARSRNDIDMTMYRMRQREFILELLLAVARLRSVLIEIAGRHHETVFPVYTHTQPAQPSTMAHYLLAVLEQAERDAVRLQAAYESTNRSPLGSCAITGTGFPIDRARTSALLGFAGPTGNTYGSIATVDYVLEAASATATALAGLGRVVQDLLLWCTREFGYLRLADGYVQCSSIMPQKRNPVALEHARALASKALAQATAIFQVVHNTPFGDTVDAEDDLQPLVASTFKDARRAVGLVAAVLRGAEFDVEALRRRAAEGWITVTELADTLTRDHNLPFRASHTIAARLIAARRAGPTAPLATDLTRLSSEVAGMPIRYDSARLEEILSPAHFVRVRTTPGGPAPSETRRALAESRDALARDERWWNDATAALRRAEEVLQGAFARLQL